MQIKYVAVALTLFSSACLAQSQPNTCPAAAGAYYFADGAWKSMDITHSAGFKIGGVFSHPLKATFRDAASPYQVKEPLIRFCLVQLIDSGRDLNLARVETSKKERTLEFGKVGYGGIKMEFPEKSLIPLKVDKQADKVYLITTVAAVSDGEYILLPILPNTAGSSNQPTNVSGYDIGFHSK